MDQTLQQLYRNAGLKMGAELLCRHKPKHPTQAAAQEAAEAYNNSSYPWYHVSAFPCVFCQKWHVGPTRTAEHLQKIVQGKPWF